MNGQRIRHFRHLYRLLPLKSDRPVEMVLHAYNYVRIVDPHGESWFVLKRESRTVLSAASRRVPSAGSSITAGALA